MKDRIEGIYNEEDINTLWIRSMSDIKRYEGLEMIHRPDLWTHVRRVAYLSKYIALFLNTRENSTYSLNVHKVFRMGLRHDDPELITSDIPAPVKRRMSTDELSSLKSKELSASVSLAKYFYCFAEGGENYKTYVFEQEDLIQKNSTESKIVNIADKWDALCEILHDIRSGNDSFIGLLPLSKKTIEGFSEYSFWETISDSFGFDSFPTEEQVTAFPKISQSDLDSKDAMIESLSTESTSEWPISYRLWASVNKEIFFLNPEKYIYSGWYLNLWSKWGAVPNHSSTVSGILLER